MKNKSTSFLDFHLWIKNGYEREWIMTLPIKEMVDWWSPRRCHWISDDGSTEPLTNQLMRTTHYPPGRAGANVGEGVKRPIGYPPLPATPDQCIDRNDRNWLRSQKAFNSIGNSDQWLISPFQPPPLLPTQFSLNPLALVRMAAQNSPDVEDAIFYEHESTRHVSFV